MADIAQPNFAEVSLSLMVLRAKSIFLTTRLKEKGRTWNVKFALKLRNILKQIEKVVESINEEIEDLQKQNAEKVLEIQKKWAVLDKNGEFVLKEDKKFTFKSDEDEDSFMLEIKANSKAFEEKADDINAALKEIATISVVAIPSDLVPDPIDGELFDAIFEFVEQ